jgi:hypothetical protein
LPRCASITVTDAGSPADAGEALGSGAQPALTLLHRAYCHLCDEMLDALRPVAGAHGAAIDVIDIDRPEHVALEQEWGERVPVLFRGAPVAANELCRYHLDARRVETALAGGAEFASPTKIG